MGIYNKCINWYKCFQIWINKYSKVRIELFWSKNLFKSCNTTLRRAFPPLTCKRSRVRRRLRELLGLNSYGYRKIIIIAYTTSSAEMSAAFVWLDMKNRPYKQAHEMYARVWVYIPMYTRVPTRVPFDTKVLLNETTTRELIEKYVACMYHTRGFKISHARNYVRMSMEFLKIRLKLPTEISSHFNLRL